MRNARADILLHEGRLTYTLSQVEIDKGRASGRFDVDSTLKPPKMALSLSADHVPSETILAQVLDNALLAGDMKVDTVLAGRGRNLQEVLATLDGTVNLTIEKSKLIGFNLRRSLLEWWRAWSFDPAQRTNFERISGSYRVHDGVARTVSDLSMSGPEIQITSSGSVSLPTQTIDQNVRLKAFPPPQHLAVPLKVDGSWAHPAITWDWLSMLLNPSISGAPNSVSAAPEPMPADVKIAVEQFLKGPNASQLSPQARELLQTLLR
jgi:AsmA protein